MLKLDLLPAHYTIARRNRKVIFMSIPLIVGVAFLWLLVTMQLSHTIARTQAELEETKAEADKVRKLQEETEKKKAELQPIQDKVDFIMAADKSGRPYWERFHEINKFIYERAIMTRFAITPPSSVSFEVELETTEDAGRFILNLIQCPAITGISISGQPAQGGVIEGVSGAASAAAGPGGPGAPGMPGPGAPGMPPEAMGGMPGPGGPGMPGPGGPPAGGAPAGRGAQGPIRLTVTATLTQPITVPQPPGAAPAGGAMMGGPGGPGAPMGEPGMMGGGPGGPPGAGPPPGEAGGPPGAGPPAGPKGGGGGPEEGGGGPKLRRGGEGGGEE